MAQLFVVSENTAITGSSPFTLLKLIDGDAVETTTTLYQIFLDLKNINPSYNCFITSYSSGVGRNNLAGYFGIMPFSADWGEGVPHIAASPYIQSASHAAGIERMTGVDTGSRNPYCYTDGNLIVNIYNEWYLSAMTYEGITYVHHGNGQESYPEIACLFANECYVNGEDIHSLNWESWEYLSGNRGQFNMTLSTLDSSVIGEINVRAYTSDTSKYSLTSQTSMYNILVNMLDNTETKIAYCGDNYITATRQYVEGTAYDIIYYTLKFYFRSDTPIYTSDEHYIIPANGSDHYLCICYDENAEKARLNMIHKTEGSSTVDFNFESEPSNEEMRAMYIWLQDNGTDRSEPYDTGSEDVGGDPGNPRPQDHVPDSSMPTTGALNLGLITLYRPTDAQLVSIAQFLWSDDVLDNFKKYFNNFSDNILALYSLPYVPSGLSTRAFKVGTLASETITNVEYCNVRYFDIDMGSVDVSQLWGSYLDYSPYTKIEIYLPYIGLHSLDIDEIMSPAKQDGTLPTAQGSTIGLVYRLDILTGIVVAKVKINGEIRYQFSGKCGFNIPLTGNTYTNLINGFITATAGAATMLATGGLTAPFTAAAAVTGTVQAQKPQVTRIGNISGDASALATDVPYIIITVPNKPLLANQGEFTGFPSYKSGTLGNFSGFTQVIDAHVEGISCTEEERAEILSLLKEGVII